MNKEIDKIAYIKTENGKVLSTRSKGKNAFYFPGGKRENNESDQETLIREIAEELTVVIIPDSIQYIGTFWAQADGHATGVMVKMTCYSADYTGQIEASSEIAEVRWLNYSDIDIVSAVDKKIFEFLKKEGTLC
jgi:8-oxo-dGTP diphosphatase